MQIFSNNASITEYSVASQEKPTGESYCALHSDRSPASVTETFVEPQPTTDMIKSQVYSENAKGGEPVATSVAATLGATDLEDVDEDIVLSVPTPANTSAGEDGSVIHTHPQAHPLGHVQSMTAGGHPPHNPVTPGAGNGHPQARRPDTPHPCTGRYLYSDSDIITQDVRVDSVNPPA